MVEPTERPRTLSSVVRILVIWVIQTAALITMAFLLKRVTIDSFGTALWAVAVIGLLNALLWPLLSFILVPFAVVTRWSRRNANAAIHSAPTSASC